MRRPTLLAVCLLAITGCGQWGILSRTFHQRCGWKADNYFTDLKAIALCRAIEAKDLVAMERLVQAGADVNARGKGNMTPLLWAFPDNHLPRFKWLLEHGADPNVVIESDFNTGGFIVPGDAVTHFVCKTAFSGYFEAVFKNGGDPNLRSRQYDDIPLTLVIQWGPFNREHMIRKLVAVGADPNILSAGLSAGRTPAMKAISWGGQYHLASLLLDLGADHRVYETDGMRRLIHVAVQEERAPRANDPQQKADYQALLTRLTDRGESIEAARNDLKRWDSWSRTTGEYRENMAAEVAQRKAREKAGLNKLPE
jgi:hypothetical protein